MKDPIQIESAEVLASFDERTTKDPIYIEGGEVLASLDDRTVTGLLIPYGEKGRTNVGTFEVEAGVIRIPADPSVVGLNLDHDRFEPVGRGSRVWEEPAGIMASLTFAHTPEGDAALADARDPKGKRRRLSGEFRTGIKNGKATGGVLAGAALVEKGAFPSAMVLAADTPDDEDDAEPVTDPADEGGEVVSSDRSVGVYTDEEGNKYRRVYESKTTVTPITEAATEAAPDQEDTTVTAALPNTQRQGAPLATVKTRGPGLAEVFASVSNIRKAMREGDAAPDADVKVLAALTKSTLTGPGSLPEGGDALRPDWIGELEAGIPYTREFITLGNLSTAITAGGKRGYRMRRGTKAAPKNRFNGGWAGNHAAINSGTGFTEGAVSELFRFAFGDSLGREFYDLPGGEEFVASFLEMIIEDHLIWSDLVGLDTWNLVAGAPIAPQAYPGVDGHDYSGAIGQVIQGISAVTKRKADNRKDTATFIIANEKAFDELLYTPKDLLPEFVNFTASTDWTGSGDGLRLVVGDTGVESTASVIVGSGKAVDFDEIPGGPLKIDAVALATGAVENAVHGYVQRFIRRAEAVVHIGKSDAWAKETSYREGMTVDVGGKVLQAVASGKIPGDGLGVSGGTAPTAPALGETVEDGSGDTAIMWKRLA